MTACVSGERMNSANALPARRVDARTVGRVHFHHGVDVQQGPVLLDQDRQVDALAERQVGRAIGEGVRAPIIGDAERLSHPLPGLDVPGAPRLHAGLLPQLRAPGYWSPTCRRARRSAIGFPRSSSWLRAASASPLILAGSSAGPMITKSLYMTRRRFVSLPSITYFFSSVGRVHQGHVGLALRGQSQRLPGSDRERLHGIAGLRLEHRHQHVEQPRVLGAGGRRQDHGGGLRHQRSRREEKGGPRRQRQSDHRCPSLGRTMLQRT